MCLALLWRVRTVLVKGYGTLFSELFFEVSGNGLCGNERHHATAQDDFVKRTLFHYLYDTMHGNQKARAAQLGLAALCAQ